MTTYYLNGNELTEGQPFESGGFTYPYAWLEGATQSTLASMGISNTTDIEFDSRYYIAVGVPKNLDDIGETTEGNEPLYEKEYSIVDGQVVTTYSDVQVIRTGLKKTCTAEIKQQTNTLLNPTDYYIIRNAVESVVIPAEVSTYRAAVITESDRVVNAIADVTTVEELIEVMSTVAWPEAD
jgi:hypothetical protein